MKSSRKSKALKLIEGDGQVGRDVMNFPYLSLELSNQLIILHHTILYLDWVFTEHAFSLAIELGRIKLINFHVTPETNCLIFFPIIASIKDRDDL